MIINDDDNWWNEWCYHQSFVDAETIITMLFITLHEFTKKYLWEPKNLLLQLIILIICYFFIRLHYIIIKDDNKWW